MDHRFDENSSTQFNGSGFPRPPKVARGPQVYHPQIDNSRRPLGEITTNVHSSRSNSALAPQQSVKVPFSIYQDPENCENFKNASAAPSHLRVVPGGERGFKSTAAAASNKRTKPVLGVRNQQLHQQHRVPPPPASHQLPAVDPTAGAAPFVIHQDDDEDDMSAAGSAAPAAAEDFRIQQDDQEDENVFEDYTNSFPPPPPIPSASELSSILPPPPSSLFPPHHPSVTEFRQNVSISSVGSDGGVGGGGGVGSSGADDVYYFDDENESLLLTSSAHKAAVEAEVDTNKSVSSAPETETEDDDDEEELLASGGHVPRTRQAVPEPVICVTDYADEIFAHARERELEYLPKCNYMEKQTDISFPMRSILVDWLIEVSEEFELETETTYLACNYVDRFLSYMSVQRAKLQLVGTASMFIASKYEEIYPKDLAKWVYITDDTYNKRQVLKMEKLILGVLKFSVSVPTAHYFVTHLAKMAGCNDKTTSLAQYLAELTLLDGETYLCHLPSVIGAAAVALARHTMGFAAWDPAMAVRTGYSVADFQACLVSLHGTFSRAKRNPQQSIVEKYKHARFHGVSNVEPTPIF